MTSCKTTNFPNGLKVGECLELDGEVETPFLNKETLIEQNVASDVVFSGTITAKEVITAPSSLKIGSNFLDQAGIFLQQSSEIDGSKRFLIGRDYDDSGSLAITSEKLGIEEVIDLLDFTGTRFTFPATAQASGSASPGVNAYQTATQFFVYTELVNLSLIAHIDSFEGTIVSTITNFNSGPIQAVDITEITQANPAVVTAPGHTYITGDDVGVNFVTDMTEINGKVARGVTVSGDDITMTGIDSTLFTPYSGGGGEAGGLLVTMFLDNPNRVNNAQTYFTDIIADQDFEIDGLEVVPTIFAPWNRIIGQDIDSIETILTNSDIGVNIGDIVQLEDVGGMAGLPAVDGSQLTNISPKDSDDIENVSTVSGSTVTDALDNLNSGLGEVNTSSNAGAGAGLALTKSGVDLPFKSILEGTNVTITQQADTITISANDESPDVVPLTRTKFVDIGTASTDRDGSISNPYNQITEALAAITDASTSNRYVILVGPGNYSNPTAKPFIFIVGEDKETVITGSFAIPNIAGQYYFEKITIGNSQTDNMTVAAIVNYKDVLMLASSLAFDLGGTSGTEMRYDDCTLNGKMDYRQVPAFFNGCTLNNMEFLDFSLITFPYEFDGCTFQGALTSSGSTAFNVFRFVNSNWRSGSSITASYTFNVSADSSFPFEGDTNITIVDRLSTADMVEYDNASSSLTSDNVNDAIDELDDRVTSLEDELTPIYYEFSDAVPDTATTMVEASPDDTTPTNWVATKAFTAPNTPPAGQYEINTTFSWSIDSTLKQALYRLTINGAQATTSFYKAEPQDVDNVEFVNTPTPYIHASDGPIDLVVEFLVSDAGAGTATLTTESVQLIVERKRNL